MHPSIVNSPLASISQQLRELHPWSDFTEANDDDDPFKVDQSLQLRQALGMTFDLGDAEEKRLHEI